MQTTGLSKKPSPRKAKNSNEVDQGKSPTSIFIALVLDMTWKLAIVVLLPIILGRFLSDHFNNSAYLLLGIAVALILSMTVVYQSYNAANRLENGKKGNK